MKRMTLDDEEIALITAHRQRKSIEVSKQKQVEFRAACEHNFIFDFHNYKTTYYKCSKCGQGMVK